MTADAERAEMKLMIVGARLLVTLDPEGRIVEVMVEREGLLDNEVIDGLGNVFVGSESFHKAVDAALADTASWPTPCYVISDAESCLMEWADSGASTATALARVARRYGYDFDLPELARGIAAGLSPPELLRLRLDQLLTLEERFL